MDKRLQKQSIVALIFFIIIGFASFGLFKIVVPPKPSPTPDPTANLSPLVVQRSVLIPVNEEQFDYDFMMFVVNDNPNFGAKTFKYQIEFIDQLGNIANTLSGSSYILPGDSRYIIESPLKFNAKIKEYRLKIAETKWQQLDPLLAQNIQISLQGRPSFEIRDTPGVFGVVAGNLRNNSQFNINNVDIAVVLQNSAGDVLGVAKTSLNTFIAGTLRGFETKWFSPLSETPTKAQVFYYTNIFDLENIIRGRNGSQIERFQEF